MEVLIVSKTHMSAKACVGGLVLSNNRYIRLLNTGNYNQPQDTDFAVGQVWDLEFTNRAILQEPHIEDIILTSKRYLRTIDNLPSFFTSTINIDWNNHVDNLFNGLINWTNSGTGYIPFNGIMPPQSVGFWISDKDLVRATFDNKIKYRYLNGTNYRNIAFVGFQEAISIIPAGTILRVSLSRIFPPENSEINVPRGYYLQLSGWYL